MDLELKDDSLSYEHVFAASVETVYQHFTNVSLASQWMAPGEMNVNSLSMDAQPGGNFRLEMVNTEGQSFTAYGVYSEVITNKRLAYSWQWQDGDGPETYVEIDFMEVEAGCMIRFKHYGFATPEAAKSHSEGWAGILVKLEGLLSLELG